MALFTLSVIPSDTVDAAWAEIRTASPRAAILVGAAFVERHVEYLIRSRLEVNDKVTDRLFDANGALGSFSAKINLAYVMGLYSHQAWKELDTMRDIRNDFAHELDISPDTQSVKDRFANLVLWKQWKITISAEGGDDANKIDIKFDDTPDDNPAKPYLSACHFYLAMLSTMTNHREMKI